MKINFLEKIKFLKNKNKIKKEENDFNNIY